MGKTITPKYRLEVTDYRGTHVQAWQGRATEKRLGDWIERYHRSLELGGCNEHISISMGHVPYVNSVRIVNQKTGQVVAEYHAAMFQVV